MEVQINLFGPIIGHVFILSKESRFSIVNAQMEEQNSEIWLSDVGCPMQARTSLNSLFPLETTK